MAEFFSLKTQNLKKKKKEEEEVYVVEDSKGKKVNQNTSNELAPTRLSQATKYKTDTDFFTPSIVKKSSSNNKSSDSNWKDIFKSFSDGYDFGDVTRSIITGTQKVGNMFLEKQVIEPIGDFGQNYKYGKLTEDLGMEAYKKMMGEDNKYDELKREHDEFISKNPELINDVQLLDQTIQTLPNSLGGLAAGIKGGGIGSAIGATAGAIIGGAGAAIGTGGTGAAAGATAGATVGAKWLGGAGYVTGSADYTYKLESGLQYQTLIEMGVPEDIAKEEAKDTGAINAFIEGGESILDLVTFGGISAVKGALTKGLVEKYGKKTVAKWVGENVVKNAVSEGIEEGLQEATSIHNEKQAMEQAGLERDDSQDKERIIQSGIAGGFAGGIIGGGTAVITGTTKAGINTIQNKNQTDNTAQIQGLQQEIAKETEELNKAQDAREKQIRQEKIEQLNTELNELTNAQQITDESTVENLENNVEKEQVKQAKKETPEIKTKQLEIIQKTNPMQDDYHTGIRSVEDIKTFDETINDDESFVWGDFSQEDAKKALEKGTVTVYSSKPIEQGAFVSTSQNQARDYAGNGKIYSQEVNLSDVAWINGDEGQYAKVENTHTTEKQTVIKSVDNQNREIGTELQEKLKNSKARDKQGRLLTVYHGSPNENITEFDSSKAGSNTQSDFTGLYFTDNQEVADDFSYEQLQGNSNLTYKRGKKGKVYESYLNIEKPLDLNNLTDEDIDNLSKYIDTKKAVDGIEFAIDTMKQMNKYKNAQGIKFHLDLEAIKNSGEYDGIIADMGGNYKGSNEYIVFDNGQIENLTNNTKTEQEAPTQQEIDNLLDIQKNKSGSEYASAFFALRDKYGEAKLYKALNKEYSKQNTEQKEVVTQVEEAIAPLQETIKDLTEQIQEIKEYAAPVSQEVVEQERQANMNSLVNEVAPIDSGLTTEESNMLDAYEEHINTHGIESLDTEERNTYNELKQRKELDATPESAKEKIKVESPLYDRDIDKVGNRKVKAYQYENPEVKPYFQQEANNMLGDLDNTIKGERIPLFGEDGYIREWTGTTRQTTEAIAYLKDRFGYSYDQIRQGLNKIIEDDGLENNAVSKRIEFMLDERLREGYTDIYGYKIPPNQEYIDFLVEKQITEYNKEAFNALTDKDTPLEIAPELRESVLSQETTPSEQLIPMTEKTRKLGKIEGRVTEPTIPEPVKDAKQLTLDGTEEDLVAKTKKQLRRELIEPNKEFFENALDNAKNRSMAFMNNTDTIRNTELVFGREAGKVINDAIFQKEIDNEADSIAWQNKERQEIKDLGIKARSKESAAVQKYGEKQYVNEEGKLVPYGDAELAREFPDIDTQNNIKEAARVIRNKYDNYIDEANEVLTRLGFDPIKKRKDYMRHFQELTDVFSRNGIPFNAKNMQEHVLPTDINGLTEFWSPQKNYFASMQPRKGIKTNYDAITGIDGYISGISNLIFHTEDIQRGRAFEELIRETYGEAKGWENLEKLPDELKQARADKIQENHLSNYAAWVHEWTNNVAGKKNKLDRSVEATFGRKAFSVLDEIRKQVGSNMIGFNVSSSLTNLVAPVQAMSKTNKLAMAKGTADTIKNIFVKDNFVEKNKFLTSRFGTDMLSKNAWQKIQDAGFVFMKGTDWFTSNQIVRSKYYELRAKGLSDADAHTQAGQFAARIMGDRTKGAAPQLYNSKLVGLVTQFQLEVNNQLYSQFYDTYQESKENAKGNALKTAAGMTFTLGQLFAYTHLFGQTFEAIAGYNPTFDVIEIIKTAFGWGEDEDEEKTTSERLKSAADQLVDALPYVNILTGGGRIPVASGIPNLIGVATGGTDNYGNELTLEDELNKLLYLLPPTGGNQFKKTSQGLSMFDDDFPIAGSYTDSGNLRYTVEDNAKNRLQAGLFGKWANENAQAYIDSGFKTIDKDNIEELVELDFDSNEYRKYKKGLNEIKQMELKDGEARAPYLFDYIDKQDVTEEQKSTMIKHLLSDKEFEDTSALNMSAEQTIEYYEAKSSITQEIAEYANDKNLLTGDTESEEYKEAVSGLSAERKSNIIDTVKNTNLSDEQKAYLYGKYYSSDKTLDKVIESGIDFDDFLTYSKDSLSIESTEDKAKYLYESNMTDDAKTVIYETSVLSGFDDEKKYKDYKVAKAVGVDINSWLSYKKQEFVADKDSDGDSIRGSRKDKIFSFINSLDLDNTQKAILKRTEYSTFDDYNNDIVNYVNNLDLEYEERIKVLENLDFTIGKDGYVYWD